MFWSKAFIPTIKETPQEAESVSHQLMLRAGIARMLMAGVYSYLPLGLKALDNIEKIIREEMNSCGAAELLLPALQPIDLWVKSGRDKDIADVMYRFVDRRGRNVCLGPTHEEVITDLVKNHTSSYRQLPVVLYQIQTKFRDEIRPRFGLVRACEFIMKDAYSFDKDDAGLDINYKAMYEAYIRIFKRCGLDIVAVEADSGVMGGKVSHEFMVPASMGEDVVLVCPSCKRAMAFKGESVSCPHCNTQAEKVNTIEIGHIFKLGTKYSAALGAHFIDAEGKERPIIMGCYGIGVSRLIATIIEQNHDPSGIVWPREVSPYQLVVLPLDITDPKIMEFAHGVYRDMKASGVDVLFDDRDERAGVKFKDADLIGVPLQVIIGKESVKKNTIELKVRKDNSKIIDTPESVVRQAKDILLGKEGK